MHDYEEYAQVRVGEREREKERAGGERRGGERKRRRNTARVSHIPASVIFIRLIFITISGRSNGAIVVPPIASSIRYAAQYPVGIDSSEKLFRENNNNH